MRRLHIGEPASGCKPLATNGWGIGLASGTRFHMASVGGGDRYAYVPVSWFVANRVQADMTYGSVVGQLGGEQGWFSFGLKFVTAPIW